MSSSTSPRRFLLAPLFLFSLSTGIIPCSSQAIYGGDAGSAVQTFSNNSDFKKRVLFDGPGLWLVQFYADWCGHCKGLAPAFQEASGILEGFVKLGAVNAGDKDGPNARIAAGYPEVKGFPTLMIFGADKTKPLTYEGGRDTKAIVSHMMQEAKKVIQMRMSGDGDQAGGGGGGGGDSVPEDSKVIELTSNNFKKNILDNPQVSMVAFVAPWCGHCKTLLPELHRASTKLDGEGAVLGTVDATVYADLSNTYGVKGFPTIKIFPGGKDKDPSDARDYEGQRTESGIVQAVLEEVDETGTPREIPELTSQAVLAENCDGKNRICVIAALPHILDGGAAARNKQKDILGEAAKRSRGGPYRFLWFEGGNAQLDLEKSLDLSFGFPAVVAVAKEKGAYMIMRESYSTKNISNFLRNIMSGRTVPTKLEGELPEVATVDPWDGQDGEVFEEEMSLEEIMGEL